MSRDWNPEPREGSTLTDWQALTGGFARRSGQVFFAWLRAQLLTSLVAFVVLLIALGLLGVRFFGLSAFFIAVIDLLPFVGSGLILLPWAFISLLQGLGSKALWLVIIWAGLTVLRQVLPSILMGRSLRVRPLWTLVGTLGGFAVGGPVGAIVGSIGAALLRIGLDMRDEMVARGQEASDRRRAAGARDVGGDED